MEQDQDPSHSFFAVPTSQKPNKSQIFGIVFKEVRWCLTCKLKKPEQLPRSSKLKLDEWPKAFCNSWSMAAQRFTKCGQGRSMYLQNTTWNGVLKKRGEMVPKNTLNLGLKHLETSEIESVLYTSKYPGDTEDAGNEWPYLPASEAKSALQAKLM